MLAVAVTGLHRVADGADDGHPARGVEAVATGLGMIRDEIRTRAACRSSRPRCFASYGLRSAVVFLVMILALGAGTFMLREAATAEVIGARKGFAGDNGPAPVAWLDTPGGIDVASNGDVYLRRLEQPRDPPHRRTRQHHRHRRRQQRARSRILGRLRSGNRRSARHAGRRRHRAGRRSRSSPTRTTTGSAASTGRPA